MKVLKIGLMSLVGLGVVSIVVGDYLFGLNYVKYGGRYHDLAELLIFLGYAFIALAACIVVIKICFSSRVKMGEKAKPKEKLPWKATFATLFISSAVGGFSFAANPLLGIFVICALSPFSGFFLFNSFEMLSFPLGLVTAYFYYFGVIYLFRYLKTKNSYFPWIFLILFIVLDLYLGFQVLIEADVYFG